MAILRLKHNPSHLSDEALIRDFVVRQHDLAAILETVGENTGASNQHLLILGPRGMGKTTLVNRVVAEVRRDAGLSRSWCPILFDEESYTVTSAGELWFQALTHLADQTQSPGLKAARATLQTVTDRARLRDASLARLLEFADEQGKRLLLVFENIDMIFDEQMSDDDAWDVRHTLQNEPRIMVLATSTTRLESFHDSDRPLYELFREHTLERLDLEECRTVWRQVTGSALPLNQARPIQIFTGGNTRLVMILGTFAKDRSFRELMDDLVGLIDENTPYFKANVEALPKESRKIFVTLADLWSPATARQVADQMRGDIRAVSAQLGRLEQQGIVEVARRVDKTMMYQVSERMYNLYRLLRSRSSARVHAVVEFIVRYYDQDSMQRFLTSLVTEACDLGLDRREDHVRAYCELMRRIPDHEQLADVHLAGAVVYRTEGDIARFRAHLMRAVELDPRNRELFHAAIEIALQAGDVGGARAVAEQFIAGELPGDGARHIVCSLVLEKAFAALYPDVIEWARAMMTNGPTALQGSLHLARALARLNTWDGVWSPLEAVLADEAFAEDQLGAMIEVLSLAAARGHASRAAGLLAGSVSAARMEPLLVALQRVAGEASNPPQEVGEAADDLVRDIERLRAALTATPKPSTGHQRHRRAKMNARSARARP